MGGIGDALASTSWLLLLGGGYTVYQLTRRWRAFLLDTVSYHDRQLAAIVAFFLLVPIGVLLHEFGHMLAAWSTGSRVLGLGYFGYWGYVEYLPSSDSPLLEWYVSLAGNFVTYALGLVSLFVAVRARSLKPLVRVMLAQFGVLEILHTLVFYPLISLDPDFAGDWDSIYSFRAPVASGITLAVHFISLVVLIVFLHRNREANWLLRG